MNIRDRGLAAAYRAFEAQRRTDPGLLIDEANVVSLLAAVGDRRSLGAKALLRRLQRPGVTRAQKVEWVRAGLDARERADLERILQQGTVPLTVSARELIEAVLDRGPSGNRPALDLTGLTPGATLEAINLSTAPSRRLHADDTMELGRADARGRFTGTLPDLEVGDRVRVRTRDSNGSVSDWRVVEVKGESARDSRPAQLATHRIGLEHLGGGYVSVSNIDPGRLVSEPGAKVQFRNLRTGEKSVLTLDGLGSFTEGAKVKGKPGDAFALAVTDGVHDPGLTREVAEVTVPDRVPGAGPVLPMPKPHRDELNPDGSSKYGTRLFTGPVFAQGVRPDDVQQGALGNCYFPAAIAAIAQSAPSAIERMIRDNQDGTYTVTFHRKSERTGRFEPVQVRVDGHLYVRSSGVPLYGQSSGETRPDKMELWYPLIEKAYASMVGSYDAIGSGGTAASVFEAVLGRESGSLGIGWNPLDRAWEIAEAVVRERRPVVLATYPDSPPYPTLPEVTREYARRYINSGLHANHCYTVLGVEERGGKRWLKLRNPWGESEPGNDGADDGMFELELADVGKYFDKLMWGE